MFQHLMMRYLKTCVVHFLCTTWLPKHLGGRAYVTLQVLQSIHCPFLSATTLLIVNSEKKTLNGFIIILKAFWFVFSEPINIVWEICTTKKMGCPREFYHRFMYTALSSGHSLLNLNVPFKGSLRLFSDAWSENDAVLKDWHLLTN